MKKPAKIFPFLLLVLVLIIVGVISIHSVLSAHADATTRTITVTNSSSQTIWAAAEGNAGFLTPANGGWVMAPGSTYTLTVANNWQGRVWGRTGCSFNGAGDGMCDTGNCGEVLQCNGMAGVGPQTLAEFTLSGWGGNDFYDVSYVDGFNLPMTITPVGGAPIPTNQSSSNYRCGVAGCGSDLNPNCPSVLQDKNAAGQIVGCRSACEVYGTDQYCCEGTYVGAACNPTTWPVNYAAYFKSQCPNSYSYAYDDATSTFTDTDADYQITFGATKTQPAATPTQTVSQVITQGTPVSLQPTPMSTTINGLAFTQGASGLSASQMQFWFQPKNWKASYVILHYTASGQAQQNVQMTYNASASRWEYNASGLAAGAIGNYSFTYNYAGQQTDTSAISWMNMTPIAKAPPDSQTTPTGQTYTQGASNPNANQKQFWFQPANWQPSYVILHYTAPGQAQQNVQMTYDASTSRWEYTANGLSSSASVTYSFTYNQSGQQGDTNPVS